MQLHLQQDSSLRRQQVHVRVIDTLVQMSHKLDAWHQGTAR